MQNRLWAMARPASGIKGNAGQEAVVLCFSDQLGGAFLYMFSGVCFLVVVLGFLVDICTESEAAKMLATGLCAFMLPAVAGWLIGKIVVLKWSVRRLRVDGYSDSVILYQAERKMFSVQYMGIVCDIYH